jgi:hypothetical protein
MQLCPVLMLSSSTALHTSLSCATACGLQHCNYLKTCTHAAFHVFLRYVYTLMLAATLFICFVVQLLAIMLAGYETSVSVTCVALHLLPKYPEVLLYILHVLPPNVMCAHYTLQLCRCMNTT